MGWSFFIEIYLWLLMTESFDEKHAWILSINGIRFRPVLFLCNLILLGYTQKLPGINIKRKYVCWFLLGNFT